MIESLEDFLCIIGAITIDIWYDIIYFIQINIKYVAPLLNIVLPYIMYILGQQLVIVRHGVKFGGELVIPIICIVVIRYLRGFANKIGKGDSMPTPNKRFTEVDDSGEVTVEYSRMQELLLYMADLEDYMQRKRLL